jgi:phosphopantothenoylcysteine decarboxylase/phosphopantothenate--cysteine ligase
LSHSHLRGYFYSANTIANLASGKADDLLSSVVLASDCPILIAPAMNQQMYAANSVQANLKTLAEHQVLILAPESGEYDAHLSAQIL